MKRLGRFFKSKKGTLILFAAAAVLLATSSVGGARAALIYSQTYSSQVQMFDIGVALVENGEDVSSRDYDESTADGTWIGDPGYGPLLKYMLDTNKNGKIDAGEEAAVKPGKTYPEELRVRNNGTINEYVRVTVYKYWTRQSGGEGGTPAKDPDLSPDLIDLHLLTGNGWSIDEGSSTDERTVLYYSPLLNAGALSEPFSDTITINGDVVDYVKQATETTSDGSTVTTTTYAYDGAQFVVEAHVDAVQEHNAADAIWSAWGRHAEAGNDSMRLTD